ncbi:MAG: DUF2752 domain-containing protein [Verrucomicrobiales bacterium]
MLRLERTKRLAFFKGMTPGLVLGVIFYIGAVLFIYFESQRSGINLKPCLIWQLTGVQCPLCRGTTASVALFRGDLTQALALNPLVTSALLIFALWAILWLGFGYRLKSHLSNRSGLILFFLLLALNWSYVLLSGE